MPHESPTMTKVSREAPFPLLSGRGDLHSPASLAASALVFPTFPPQCHCCLLMLWTTGSQLLIQPCFRGPQWPHWSYRPVASLTVLAPKARGADNPVREGKSIKTVSPHCHRPPAATKGPTRSLSPQLPVHYGGHLSDFSRVSAITSAPVFFPPCLLVGSLY